MHGNALRYQNRSNGKFEKNVICVAGRAMWNILHDKEDGQLSGRRSLQEDISASTQNMKRIILRFILLFGLVNVLNAAPRRSNRIKIDPNYLKALMAYKKLEPKMTRRELKTITTIGILNGALKAEKEMEKHLTGLVTDLILNTNISDKSTALPKITKIQDTIERDKNAVHILTGAMDLATKSMSVKEYKEELQKTLDEHKSHKRETRNQKKDIDMPRLKAAILDHVLNIQRQIIKKIDGTLKYLEDNDELDMIKVNKKRNADEEGNNLKEFFAEDKVENNLIDTDNKSVSDTEGRIMNKPSNIEPNETFEFNTNDESNKTANQMEGSDEDNGEGGAAPGGLVGLIASLSGGEGGSDIGALVGALTGVIAQIFGPGGLDIESLISTGTSLISGLLSGDKNFGTVLGEYVGTAFDGLSGGGGAINNGKFIGNLLGTIVASLSADPEDDDQPPKPLVFLQTFLKTFQEAKNRAGTPEDGQEAMPAHPMGGSDSFGFVKQIISALVGGVTSLVLNAALGASGGSSQASTSALASSSHPHPPAHKPTW
ncbi:uncharacterized protein LOC129909716 [Episyrphus balteatus]|uniref:uncharacterized protein LOC129909716 n=1 Tax=Episyrphus balteatus TaxID=286459 RepID=UPI002485F5D4|nr:uncharacterized protein LOC129909716 [Episyrphus balteatus]